MSEQQDQSTTPEVTAQEIKHALLNELEQQKQVITQLSDEELEEVAGGFLSSHREEAAKNVEAAGGSKLKDWHKIGLGVSAGFLAGHMMSSGGGSSSSTAASASAAAAGTGQ